MFVPSPLPLGHVCPRVKGQYSQLRKTINSARIVSNRPRYHIWRAGVLSAATHGLLSVGVTGGHHFLQCQPLLVRVGYQFAGLCVPFLVDEPLVFVQNVVGLGCLHCCIVFGEQLDPGLNFGQKQPKEATLRACTGFPLFFLMRFNASSCCRHSDASMVTTFPICSGGRLWPRPLPPRLVGKR